MKIASALLKPNLVEIENDFVALIALLKGQTSDEAQELRTYVEKQLREVHKVKTVLFSVESNPASLLSYELFEDFHKMKLRLRFAQRRWKLILSNEARNRKMRERTKHVAPIAA